MDNSMMEHTMKTDLKTIDGNITTIRATGEKFNNLIHDTAVMILVHAHEHGDCSRAQHLVMAMPASMRRTSLIVWFGDYSPIVVKNDDQWNARMHKPETATGKPNPLYKPFNIEAATNDPWYKHAERNQERNFVPLKFEDLVKQVQQLSSRIIAQIDDGKVADEDLESAKVVARTLEELSFSKIKAAGDTAANDDNRAVLTDLRKQYQAKYNKKAFAGWTAETLQEKINAGVEHTSGTDSDTKEKAVA